MKHWVWVCVDKSGLPLYHGNPNFGMIENFPNYHLGCGYHDLLFGRGFIVIGLRRFEVEGAAKEWNRYMRRRGNKLRSFVRPQRIEIKVERIGKEAWFGHI